MKTIRAILALIWGRLVCSAAVNPADDIANAVRNVDAIVGAIPEGADAAMYECNLDCEFPWILECEDSPWKYGCTPHGTVAAARASKTCSKRCWCVCNVK